MKLWDIIKSKLFKKQDALPESSVEAKSVNSGFDNGIKVGFTPQIQKSSYLPEKGSLDFALQQYLFQIMKQYKDGRTVNSYTALTSICGMETSNPGKNAENEANFLKRIEKDKKAIVIDQPSANGGVCFRHVQRGKVNENPETRLYVNCKRENIAELAGKFYEELGNSSYYFKFCTDEQASSKRRSEQFVFYVSSDPRELNKTIQIIKKTKQKYPKLFEGSKNMNPFMKDIDGFIGYAPDAPDGIYYSLDGYSTPVSRSYNSLLGEALSDSFTFAMKDLVSCDPSLSQKTNGKTYERAYPYIRDVLEDVLENPEKQKKLMEKMKVNLQKCTARNPVLSIKGLEQEKSR